MSKMMTILKKIFRAMPLNPDLKKKLNDAWAEHKIKLEDRQDQVGNINIEEDRAVLHDYAKYVLEQYGKRSVDYVQFKEHNPINTQIHLSAYYLTQFHPNPENDAWWGKGTTEWNNVNQAIPQFIGHYQPRKPGELGYYDLRLKENMERQIEIAKNYGIKEFCFYYYWFDGKRLLERPLDMFLKNHDLNIEFSYCWANENWTKKFSGTDSGALMTITKTVESYARFIDAVLDDMQDRRYHRVNGRPVLTVYRPGNMPDVEEVIKSWRDKAKKCISVDLYLIAVQEGNNEVDWIAKGFDATTQFQPRSIENSCKEIKESVQLIRKDFAGKIYDYQDLVENKKYLWNDGKKCYPAVMPMWDNTARRNHRGTIFYNSSPELYKKWLTDVLKHIMNNE